MAAREKHNALAAMVPTRKHGPPSVIHASLMRSGTMSMARAYDRLDLRAYHGLDMIHRQFDDPGSIADWAKLERAAQTIWPKAALTTQHNSQGSTAVFGRKDWDDIFGEFDVITDVGSCFVEQLIDAYPNAKVVLVQRDFEPWWKSYQIGVLDGVFHPIQLLMKITTWPLSKTWSVEAMQQIILGAFQADNVDQVRQKGRQYYNDYYQMVRQKVPPVSYSSINWYKDGNRYVLFWISQCLMYHFPGSMTRQTITNKSCTRLGSCITWHG